MELNPSTLRFSCLNTGVASEMILHEDERQWLRFAYGDIYLPNSRIFFYGVDNSLQVAITEGRFNVFRHDTTTELTLTYNEQQGLVVGGTLIAEEFDQVFGHLYQSGRNWLTTALLGLSLLQAEFEREDPLLPQHFVLKVKEKRVATIHSLQVRCI
jgi:hypothetical protein